MGKKEWIRIPTKAQILEAKFQADLIKDIKSRLPGCVVMKNDPNYIQGIPDLTILHGEKWATLEVKKDANSSHQPNQDYYVEKMNSMSFSAFIYPENKEEVLHGLQRTLRPERKTLVSKRKQLSLD